MLCITKPWPSMIRGIWGNDERYIESYFSQAKKMEKLYILVAMVLFMIKMVILPSQEEQMMWLMLQDIV